MRFSIIASVLAVAGSAMGGSSAYGEELTTTMTATTTNTITITQCPSTVTNCPYRTTTSTSVYTSSVVHNSTSAYWSVSNATTPTRGPTAPIPTTIVTALPTEHTSVEVVTATTTTPAAVPTAAANGLVAQTGLLAAAVAAALVAVL